jgi:hypothetical protein
MKSFFIFVFFFCTCLLISCNQDEEPKSNSEFFIKFKVNNSNVEYPGNPLLPATFFFDQSGNVHAGVIQVIKPGSNGTTNVIQINIFNEEEFAINITYELLTPILYNTSLVPRVSMTYFDQGGKVYNAVVLQDNPAIPVKDRASIRFTSINNGIIEGSFEGLLLGPFDVATGRGDEERNISSGQFRLPFIKN